MTKVHTQSPLRHDTDAKLPAAAFLRYESRADGWSAGRQAAFLSHLADHGVVADAARAVGKSLAGGYALRRTARGYAFNLGWEAALLIARRIVADQLMTAAIKGEQSTWVREDGVTTFTRQNTKLSLTLLDRINPAATLPEVLAVATRFDWFLQLIDDRVSGQDLWTLFFDDALPRSGLEARARVRAALLLCEDSAGFDDANGADQDEGEDQDDEEDEEAPIEYKSMDAPVPNQSSALVPKRHPGPLTGWGTSSMKRQDNVSTKLACCFHRTSAIHPSLFRGGRSLCKSALPLFHLDLLRNAGRVLSIGLGDRTAVYGLLAQRAYAFTKVEHQRRRRFLGACWWRDPVNNVKAIGVCIALGRLGNRFGIIGDGLCLTGDLWRTGGRGLFRLNLRRACIHILGILFGRGRFEIDADDGGEHRQSNADATRNLFILGVHILIKEYQSEQRQECDHRNNRAKLVLHKETETIGAASRIMLVRRFPHQATGNREHCDAH